MFGNKVDTNFELKYTIGKRKSAFYEKITFQKLS